VWRAGDEAGEGARRDLNALGRSVQITVRRAVTLGATIAGGAGGDQ